MRTVCGWQNDKGVAQDLTNPAAGTHDEQSRDSSEIEAGATRLVLPISNPKGIAMSKLPNVLAMLTHSADVVELIELAAGQGA